ncbi:MAG: hypothetical protein ABIG30_00365, partial [Candidatus Aenigmatarchaeota archaeon]
VTLTPSGTDGELLLYNDTVHIRPDELTAEIRDGVARINQENRARLSFSRACHLGDGKPSGLEDTDLADFIEPDQTNEDGD